MTRRGLVLLLAIALLPSVTRAQTGTSMKDAARKFFEAGQVLYERGKFIEAAAQFELAFGEAPLPAFVYNAAQSYDKAGEREKAIAAYKKYLGFKEAKEEEAQIKARVAVLERDSKPAAPAAPKHTPLPYKEPVTGHVFQTFITVDGKEYVLVGVGTRKVLGFKVYAMAMYVEDEAARKAFTKLAGQAGGADNRTLADSGLVPGFIVQGEFAKHAILWFARDVAAPKQQESYREALADDLSPKATPEVRKAASDFVAMFDKDVKEGDEIVIHTEPDGRVGVQIAGGAMKWSAPSLRVVHQIWDIWLGNKPINSDLKKMLIDRVDSLGR